MSRRRNFARTLTAAFLLAVATALLLLPSAPGHAQTTTNTYVSNINQGSDDFTSGTGVKAQSFTTGSQTGGYTVTSVDIGYDDVDDDKFSAAIYTVDSDGFPDSEVFALTAPTGTWSAGDTLTFTAPANSTLSASTTYTVRMAPSGNAVAFDTTTSSDEDSGAFSGWSIQDLLDAQLSTGWIHITTGEIIRIAIKGTTPAPVDFENLQSGHTSPTGMWSPDGSTLWVGQWFSTQVYAYNLADETANYSENWTLHNPSTTADRNRKPTGIWSNGTHIYVTDADHDEVFQYNLGDKSLTSTTLSLHADNGNRQGLWSDGTTAWVSDAADDNLYAYVLSDFSRDSDKDIDLASGNTAPRGIWSDGTTIWVLDNSDEKLYAYALADGSRAADLDITLDSDGVNYNSIWSDGTSMYVIENTGGSATRDPQIHKRALPAADETVVWDATLTSADNWALGSTYTYDGYASSALGAITTTQGSLSPDSFTVGTTTHTVHVLGVREGTDNRLYLVTDTAASKSDLAGYAMEFTVDGSTTTLKVEDATPESNLGFYWAETLHSFGEDDWQAKTITVKLLRLPADDCAADTTTTCSVSLGGSVTGDIEAVGDEDYFSLSVTSGVSYQIDAEGSGTSMGTLDDPYVVLRDASGTVLALNDDGGGNLNARIIWRASSTGTVYVEVSHALDTVTGTYTLAVSEGPVDDCADDTTTTCSVSPGSPVTGDIQYSGDYDYFSLSVTSGFTYQIDAEGADTSMGTLDDPYVVLRDASDAGLASDDDGGLDFNARLVWTASSTGTVYVVIRAAGNEDTGTYTLTVSANNPATGAPTISGTAQVGQTLTAATSGITDSDGLGAPGYTYQWVRVDGSTESDISGATSSTYTLVAADLGKTIKVKVSFTDDNNFSETLTSAATAAVTAAPTGSVVWEATLTSANSWAGLGSTNYDGYGSDDSQFVPSNHGSLSPNSFTIGATTHTVEWLAVRETGDQKLFFFTDTKLGKNELAGYFLEFTVDGVKKTLQVSDATDALDGTDVIGLFWEHAVHSYGASEWQAKTITVKLRPANTPATGAPAITGTAQVGQMLSVATGSIADADGLTNASFAIQWVRVDGSTESDISGANDSTYTLVAADLGKTIKVKVSFTDDASNAETLTSAATAAVAAAGPGAVTLSATDVPVDEGEQATWTVALATQPTGTVTVRPVSDDTGAVTVRPSRLYFTTSNWDTPQTVTATALQDADGVAETVTVSHPASGGGYAAVTAGDVTVTVTDDETPTAPGMVENVRFTTSAERSLSFEWDPPANDGRAPVTNYRYSRGAGWIETGSADIRSGSFTGLTNGNRYTVSVQAGNAVGWGPSASVWGTASTETPDPISGLTSDYIWDADAQRGRLDLIWKPPVNPGWGELTYRVEMASAPAAEGLGVDRDWQVRASAHPRGHADPARCPIVWRLEEQPCVIYSLANAAVNTDYAFRVRPENTRNGPWQYAFVSLEDRGPHIVNDNPLGVDYRIETNTSGNRIYLTYTHPIRTVDTDGYRVHRNGVQHYDTHEQYANGVGFFVDSDGNGDFDWSGNLASYGEAPERVTRSGRTVTLRLDPPIDPMDEPVVTAVRGAVVGSNGLPSLALNPPGDVKNKVRVGTPPAPVMKWLYANPPVGHEQLIHVQWSMPTWGQFPQSWAEGDGWEDHYGSPDGYEVEWSADRGTTWQAVDPPHEGVEQIYAHGGLTVEDDSTFHYRVRGVNGSGAGPWSNVLGPWPPPAQEQQAGEAWTEDLSPGLQPQDLAADPTAAGNVLSWRAPWRSPEDVTGYQILRRRVDTGEQPWPIVEDTGNTGTTWRDTGVEQGVLYFYRVKTVRGRELSRASNFVEVYAVAVAALPGAPGYPVAESRGAARIDLTWTAPAGDPPPLGYEVQWSADGESGWQAVDPPHAGTETAYADTGLSGGTTRHYRVRAITDDGEGPWSAVAVATTEVPLTASFSADFSAHGGAGTTFVVRLTFSEAVAAGYRTLRDTAVQADQGEVRSVSRVNGSSAEWDITVAPSSDQKVLVTLSPGEGACGESGVICTADGRKLSNYAVWVVLAPPAANTPATGVPAIGGTAQVGETLSADTSGIADADGLDNVSFSYQWQADGAAISGATDSTYTPVVDDVGKAISVTVSFSDDAGNEEESTSAATDAVEPETQETKAANSPATGAPAVTGTAQVGETLTADTSGVADADGLDKASFSYQWQADGADISSATSDTYTLAGSDKGKAVSVKVSFTDDAGNAEMLTSAATAAVEARANSPATGAPAITGAARVGETLAANTSGIADEDGLTNATFTYQWLAGGADISGAADSTYVPVVDDAGRAIGVRVSFTDDAGFEETLSGAAVAVPADDYTVNEVWETGNWGRITVGGSATGVIEKPGDRDFFGVNLSRGRTYRIDVAGHGDVGALEQVRLYGVFVYAEDLECSGAYDDPGVTTYVLTAGHSAPHSVAVRAEGDGTGVYRVSVSESDDTGTGCDTAPAAAAQAANTPATGAPAISGTVRVGETLTVDTSGIADADGLDNASLSYQWQADGADISSATSDTYTLAGADKGKAISVKVSFTDDAGNAESLTSAATAAVEAKSNSPATGAPAISGTAQVGETLTADTSGIADADGLTNATFSYQWLADGSETQDATNATYTPVVDDMGKAMSVTVSFTDDAGNAETLTSEPTDAVETETKEAKANTPATGAPTVSGTAQVGETLTADTSGIADEDGLEDATFSYQWLADGAAVQDATDATYTPVVDDMGKAMSVTVTFTDDDGNEEELTSAATDAVEPETQEAQANNPATGLPTISGIAQVGVKLTADLSAIADVDGVTNAVHAYQWQADGADIPGETLNCYTPDDADEGKTISVVVSFTDDAGNDEELTSAATAAVEARPNRPATGALAITGTARVGELLTADVSNIMDDDGMDRAAFAYQWQADGTDLSGATGSSYTLAASDEGKAISVTVSFTDYAGHEESFTSTATAAVEAAAEEDEEPTDRPHGLSAEASGGAVVLTWTAPVVDYVVSSYHILRHRPEQGEAEPLVYVDQTPNKDTSYTDTEVEAGVLYVYRVKAIVNWMGDLGEASDAAQIRAQATSQQQTANSPATGAPTISGSAQVGETLTADTSGISDDDGLSNAVFSYQWLADGAAISGATNDTYTLADSDEGKAVSVKVTFTDDAGNDETLTSAATAAVEAKPNSPATGAPTITGTAQVGETLTAETSGIADDDGLGSVSYSYQWLAEDAEISGATDSTYTLVDTEEGKAVSVRVSFTDDAGNAETLTSIATDTVAAKPNSPATGTPTISGTAQVGETLTAETSGIADDDGLDSVSYSYQWLAEDAEINGATDSTYTLASDDVGKTIKVRVSFTDDAGHSETLTSAATGAVEARPLPPLTASLDNTPSSHDGESAFTFELRFSEEFGISYKTLRDHAFTVTGGAVRKANRLEQGSNLGWRITVMPDGDGQVVIVLPETTDCDDQGAICTEDGRMLSSRLELTVSGPGE